MSRLLALLILVIPGAISALGIKLMRDTLFDHTIKPFSALWLQGLSGFIFFAIGTLCAGNGFILYRDRKRNQVSPRFRKR
nr:DUF2627 domain-containing protein [Bacillus subtilis]